MPQTYAHYQMGTEIMRILDVNKRNVVESNKELFFVGLHGPDLLYYYKPFVKNNISELGYQLHDIIGQDFFRRALRIYKENGCQGESLAYIYGCICHFALDVVCHSYIEKMLCKTQLNHTEIELEFDIKLMKQKKINPIKMRVMKHICMTDKSAEVISKFYDNVTDKQIVKAAKGFSFWGSLILYANYLIKFSACRKFCIYLGRKLSGNYKNKFRKNLQYNKASQKRIIINQLSVLYLKSIKKAVSLIDEFDGYMQGNEIWNTIYQYNFSGKKCKEVEMYAEDICCSKLYRYDSRKNNSF